MLSRGPIFSLLLFVSSAAWPAVTWAGPGDGYHITQTAETLKPLQWSFKPYPGHSPIGSLSSFLMNSLSMGVTNRLEVGTIPLIWNNSPTNKSQNANLKYQVLSSDSWIFSSGLQYIRMTSESQSPTAGFDYVMHSSTLFLAFDWRVSERWKVAYNISGSLLTGKAKVISSVSTFDFPINQQSYVDHYLDFNYLKSLTNIWSLGLSRTTEGILGFSFGQPILGVGLSHTWNLRGAWFSQMNLGSHYKQDGASKVLFGFAF